MKGTGIIRRIDELGRVIIPKEIRRALKLREGDPVEMFVNEDGTLILKKYSPLATLGDFSKEFVDSMNRALGYVALICDTDRIVAVAGATRKEYMDKVISSEVQALMRDRKTYQDNDKTKTIPICAEEADEFFYVSQTIVPITSDGEPVGAVILVSKEPGTIMGETELKSAKTVANFIGKQLEG